MTNEHITKELSEKFRWNGGRKSTLGQKPILDKLPSKGAYGPHICPNCHGQGWTVNRSGAGELMKCNACTVVDNQRLASCWTIGALDINDPHPATFGVFEGRDEASIEIARAARTFASVPHGWLTMYGQGGGGKSHLAEAITRALLARRVPALFVKSVHLWEYLGATARNEGDDVDYLSRQRWVADVTVLVIDEIGVEKPTDTVFKLRRSLLDHRYRQATGDGGAAGATVLVSNDAPGKWTDGPLGDRALDTRFTAIECSKSSYRRIAR